MEATRRLGALVLLVLAVAPAAAGWPSRLRPVVEAPHHRLRVGAMRPVGLPGVWHGWFDVLWRDGVRTRVATGSDFVSAGLVRETRLGTWVTFQAPSVRGEVRLLGSSLRVGDVASVTHARAVVAGGAARNVAGGVARLGGAVDVAIPATDRVPASRRVLFGTGRWDWGGILVVRSSPRTAPGALWTLGLEVAAGGVRVMTMAGTAGVFTGIALGTTDAALTVLLPLAGVLSPGPAFEAGWSR